MSYKYIQTYLYEMTLTSREYQVATKNGAILGGTNL